MLDSHRAGRMDEGSPVLQLQSADTFSGLCPQRRSRHLTTPHEMEPWTRNGDGQPEVAAHGDLCDGERSV